MIRIQNIVVDFTNTCTGIYCCNEYSVLDDFKMTLATNFRITTKILDIYGLPNCEEVRIVDDSPEIKRLPNNLPISSDVASTFNEIYQSGTEGPLHTYGSIDDACLLKWYINFYYYFKDDENVFLSILSNDSFKMDQNANNFSEASKFFNQSATVSGITNLERMLKYEFSINPKCQNQINRYSSIAEIYSKIESYTDGYGGKVRSSQTIGNIFKESFNKIKEQDSNVENNISIYPYLERTVTFNYKKKPDNKLKVEIIPKIISKNGAGEFDKFLNSSFVNFLPLIDRKIDLREIKFSYSEFNPKSDNHLFANQSSDSGLDLRSSSSQDWRKSNKSGNQDRGSGLRSDFSQDWRKSGNQLSVEEKTNSGSDEKISSTQKSSDGRRQNIDQFGKQNNFGKKGNFERQGAFGKQSKGDFGRSSQSNNRYGESQYRSDYGRGNYGRSSRGDYGRGDYGRSDRGGYETSDWHDLRKLDQGDSNSDRSRDRQTQDRNKKSDKSGNRW